MSPSFSPVFSALKAVKKGMKKQKVSLEPHQAEKRLHVCGSSGLVEQGWPRVRDHKTFLIFVQGPSQLIGDPSNM